MSSSQFNFFKEKLILQEEEKELKKMLDKFKDQLNRLKIEELALISMMKMEEEKKERGEGTTDKSTSTLRRAAPGSTITESSVTSREMANYLPVGFVSDNASAINTESLNLDLELDSNNEDEEEEVDTDEEESRNAAVMAAETHQLMSFMEEF